MLLHRGYVARLCFRGGELWRCDHGHTGRGAAQLCAFRAWQHLHAWLTAAAVKEATT